MRPIDADAVMERIEQAYKDMGVDTHGVWNKQLAEIFKTADVEDIRLCLHKILGAVAQAPTIDRPQGFWTKVDVATYRCSECGKEQIADDINELNFCCCCGSRNKVRYKVQMLKGEDDD